MGRIWNVTVAIAFSLAAGMPAYAQKAQVFDGALLKCTTPEGYFLRQTDVAGVYHFSSKIVFAEDKGSFVYVPGAPQVFKTNDFFSFLASVSLGGKISPTGRIIEPPKPVQLVARFGVIGSPSKLPQGNAELRVASAQGALPPMVLAAPLLKMGLTIGKYSAEPSAASPEKVTQAALDSYVRIIDGKPLAFSFHIAERNWPVSV